jgi:hypothetical protein
MIEYGTELNTRVILKELPDGCLSRHADLTVGEVYLLKNFNGSCIIINTNRPGEDAHIWRGRADPVALTLK